MGIMRLGRMSGKNGGERAGGWDRGGLGHRGEGRVGDEGGWRVQRKRLDVIIILSALYSWLGVF